MPYNFLLFLFNFLFLAWTRLEISVLEGRSATMSQHYLVAIASILSMLVFIALVQLAQTSSAMPLLGVAGGCCNSKALLMVQGRVRGRGTFSGQFRIRVQDLRMEIRCMMQERYR